MASRGHQQQRLGGVSGYDPNKKSIDWLHPPADSPEREASAMTSVFNLVSTMVGGGVLCLPYAFSLAGVVLGPILLVLCALASDFSLYILIAGSRRTGATSYGGVTAAAFGRAMEHVTSLNVLLLTFLACIGYMILIRNNVGSLVEFVLGRVLTGNQRNLVLVVCVLVILPVACLRSLNALRFSCVVSFASICLLALCTGYRSIEHNVTLSKLDEPHPSVKLFAASYLDAIRAFPLISLAFLCHFNALPMHKNLHKPTRKKVKTVLHLAIGLAAAIYLITGLFGYFYAYDTTKDDILLNFSSNDLLINFGRLALSLTVMLNLPIIILPCRAEFESLLYKAINAIRGRTPAASEESVPLVNSALAAPGAAPEDFSSFVRRESQHLLLTIVVVGLQLAIACVTPGIGVVWSIMGSTVGIGIGYILPASSYLVIRRHKPFERRKLAAWVLLISGIFLMVVCSYDAFRTILS